MSPVPFFRQVERVGILCAADADPAVPGATPDAAALCGIAAEELTALLGGSGPAVVALAPNDERLTDPATLVVVLHAHTRAAEGGPAGAVTAFAATLYRSRADAGAPPFFIAPPEAVVSADGRPPPEAIRPALRRLLASAVARPIQANR